VASPRFDEKTKLIEWPERVWTTGPAFASLEESVLLNNEPVDALSTAKSSPAKRYGGDILRKKKLLEKQSGRYARSGGSSCRVHGQSEDAGAPHAACPRVGGEECEYSAGGVYCCAADGGGVAPHSDLTVCFRNSALQRQMSAIGVESGRKWNAIAKPLRFDLAPQSARPHSRIDNVKIGRVAVI